MKDTRETDDAEEGKKGRRRQEKVETKDGRTVECVN